MIRRSSMVAVVVLGLAGVVVLPACQTDSAGVKSSYRSQWANVDADTERATEAAEAALEELNLQRVEAASTAVDGQAVGYTADGTKVTVSVSRVAEDASQVSVNVGTLGDPDLGEQILLNIRERLAE